MSVVTVQFGQCGNQIIDDFYENLFENISEWLSMRKYESSVKGINTFFEESKDGSYEARCVQVDMEPRVIESLHSKKNKSHWSYPMSSHIISNRGSGNNWAYGYNINGSACEEPVLNLINRELEKCDSVDGLLSTMSLAGGTGSGLAQLVWPYFSGEVSIQVYNIILALGHIFSSIDIAPGLILNWSNDVLHSLCQHSFRTVSSSIELKDVNRLITHQLTSLLFPIDDSYNENRPIQRTVRNLCPIDAYRMVRIRTIPYNLESTNSFSTDTWQQLLRHGHQMLLNGSMSDSHLNWSLKRIRPVNENQVEDHYQPYVSALSILRGNELSTLEPKSINNILYSDLKVDEYADNFKSYTHNLPLKHHFKSITMATNGGGIFSTDYLNDFCSTEKFIHDLVKIDMATQLNYCLTKAWRMFASKAFLHKYYEYGINKHVFLDCFSVVEQLSHDYQHLSDVHF